MPNEATPANLTEVRIAVERDADAYRITAVLEALGYAVVRDIEPMDPAARVRWAVEQMARRYKLTTREAEILQLVLAGESSNTAIGKMLELSSATVKWHMHNIFAKSGTDTREGLLRRALQLPDLAAKAVAVENAPGSEPPAVLNLAHPGDAQLADEHRRSVAAVPSKSWF
jgi:DNA-binding CsgD family transcriptional regulator